MAVVMSRTFVKRSGSAAWFRVAGWGLHVDLNYGRPLYTCRNGLGQHRHHIHRGRFHAMLLTPGWMPPWRSWRSATASDANEAGWRTFECNVCGRIITTERLDDPDDPGMCWDCSFNDYEDRP